MIEAHTLMQPISYSTLPQGMVLIPGGEFTMGSDSGGPFERPVHRVHLDPFFIDETPVTNEQFAAFVAATGYMTTAEKVGDQGASSNRSSLSWLTFATPSRADHPVIYVSWHDAEAFARWAKKRLPTEAEWEKAARGGLDGKLFPWGEAGATGHAQWNQQPFDSNAAPPTSPVKSFAPNGFGVFDIVGNVWEWCQDWYEDSYYSLSPSRNPQGPSAGRFRVRRGGSWNVREEFRLRCANRGAMLPESSWPNLGFRCAKSIGDMSDIDASLE